MYACFFVRTNHICIIVSIEVPDYPKTSHGIIWVRMVFELLLSAVLVHKNSWDIPTGHVPRSIVPGRQNTLQQQLSHRTIVLEKCTTTIKFTPTPKLNRHNEIASPLSMHHQESSCYYTTSPSEKWIMKSNSLVYSIPSSTCLRQLSLKS